MMNLKIVSPQKVEFQGTVKSVLVPGTLGQFEILTGHAPIISSLASGNVVYEDADGKHTVEISGGFVEVQKDQVSICVELPEE